MKKYRSLLLVLVVLVLCGCSFSFNTNEGSEVTNNGVTNSIEDVKTYAYSNIVGVYEAKNTSLRLYLYGDATFSYLTISGGAPSGYVGNYTITDNNKIKLNYLFPISGLDDVLDSSYNKVLTIKSDGMIVDSNFDSSSSAVELEKTNDYQLNIDDSIYGLNGRIRDYISGKIKYNE